MTLEFGSLPLAWLAGALGVLSPCVWPLVPVVVSSANAGGRGGPWFLALGLATAFGASGTLLTLLVLNLGLDPESVRYVAAVLLVLVSLALLVETLGEWLTEQLSTLVGRARLGSHRGVATPAGQFGVGALLGFVWLPCVGPTLGAAITLASLGQDLGMAFAIMFAFGVGTSSVLLAAGFTSTRLLSYARPRLVTAAATGKKLLGWTLLALGISVLSGLDKVVETWAVRWMPAWAFGF